MWLDGKGLTAAGHGVAWHRANAQRGNIQMPGNPCLASTIERQRISGHKDELFTGH